jgi:hypothetical protein
MMPSDGPSELRQRARRAIAGGDAAGARALLARLLDANSSAELSESVADALAWSDQPMRSRMLPWKSDLTDQWAAQPQLPAGAGDEPGPAIGGIRVAGMDGGPAEGLFEQTERLLDREAPQISAPHCAQVRWQRTTDPRQPQWPRRQLCVGQALDLDTDHAEGSIRRAADMQAGPDIDLHGAVGGVGQVSRLLFGRACPLRPAERACRAAAAAHGLAAVQGCDRPRDV